MEPVMSDRAVRAADRAFLGLDMADGARGGTVPVAQRVLTPDGRLYGGAMLAVAIAAMETATERRIVWATTQFVASAPHGARLDCEVDVVAQGGRSAQVQVRASTNDGLMFTALGATGVEQPEGFAADYFTMPEVPDPVDCAPLLPAAPEGSDELGYKTVTDIRGAGVTADDGPPRLLVWASTPAHYTSHAPMIALVADQLPLTLARLAGKPGAGASLDNTLRAGPRVECEWVLLELRPELGFGGYGHGTVYAWSPDGILLAVGSQSSGMRVFPGHVDITGS